MTAAEIAAAHIGEIAQRLLGEPNAQLSSRTQLRFGANGSVAVEIGGAERGQWFGTASFNGATMSRRRYPPACSARLRRTRAPASHPLRSSVAVSTSAPTMPSRNTPPPTW
jgi:hypothetical protein